MDLPDLIHTHTFTFKVPLGFRNRFGQQRNHPPVLTHLAAQPAEERGAFSAEVAVKSYCKD